MIFIGLFNVELEDVYGRGGDIFICELLESFFKIVNSSGLR